MNRSILLFLFVVGLMPAIIIAADEPDHASLSEAASNADDDHDGNDEHESASLNLSEARLVEFGVQLETALPGVIHQQVTLPGEVQLNRERVAHINPRFSAKVIKVLARTGDQVKAGQVLAVAESSDTLARFNLTSLIDGTVTNLHITLGEVLDSGDTAFVVADLSVLWVDIDLYPKHVSQVAVGQPVVIAAQHGPKPVNTQIDYVAPLVDEQTRTGLARVFLNNDQGQWKPGTFITAFITIDKSPADIAVPLSAVIDLDSQSLVFVQEGTVWEPRPVTLGRRDRERVEILSGLTLGERYVSKGGFVLKAQLQKGAFDDGHGH
jgi:cobalt-zinc-cadmium efflux system membrane fusion protein